jgi:hypothetical protein
MDVPEGARETSDDQRLAGEDQRHSAEDFAPVRHDESRVEQHSDGDKEQQSEDVAQGDNVAQRLMAEFGFTQHQARDECAEGE